MFIAHQLKSRNIVEYLLYMWQIEDLIRAMDLDMERINRQVVEPYPLSEKEKKQLYEWYESLIDMMRAENATAAGRHIQLNKNTLIQLNDFHGEMLTSGHDASYNAKYYSIVPTLAHLRQKQGTAEIGELEMCFNLLYGIMMLRMQGKTISADTQKAQTDISEFLMMLNTYYQRYRSGDLVFDDAR